MKRNVGEFSLWGFVLGIVISVSLGWVLYGKFRFQQQPRTQDTSQVRLDALEQKLAASESKIDTLEKQVIDLKLKGSASKADSLTKTRNR
jgi:hypothetical protein